MANTAEIISITSKAQDQLGVICAAQNVKFVRIGVIGGGCSGLSYKIDFDDPKDNDTQHSLSGCTVLVDPKSSIYLRDVVLDFKDGLQGKGFVFQNPNATNTCGCGESFSV